MTLHRFLSRTCASALAGVSAAVMLAAVPAAAAPTGPVQAPPVATPSVAPTEVRSVVAALGDRSAGYWYDQREGYVVAVTKASDARLVRDAGATPKLVDRDAADLRKVTRALDRMPRIPGTAWHVDVAANRVVVGYDDTVSGESLDRLRSVTVRFGDAARLRYSPGTFAIHNSGGDPIFSGGVRCVLGFNVIDSNGDHHFITAGHCADVGSSWSNASGTHLGTTVGSSFPGNDFAVVRYVDGVSHPGNVNLGHGAYQDIRSAGNGYVGQSVCHVGPVSGLQCGTITALNATIAYPEGTIYGVIRTNICSQPGDSGAPLFANDVAIGTLIGGNCGTSYYQPVVEVLQTYGLTVA